MLCTASPPPFPDSFNTVEAVCLLIERMMMILQRMKTKNGDYSLTAVMNIN